MTVTLINEAPICTSTITRVLTDMIHNLRLYRLTGTDQVLGKYRAERVNLVGVLRRPIQQVTSGDGSAHCHRHAHHWETGKPQRRQTLSLFFFLLVHLKPAMIWKREKYNKSQTCVVKERFSHLIQTMK